MYVSLHIRADQQKMDLIGSLKDAFMHFYFQMDFVVFLVYVNCFKTISEALMLNNWVE